MITGTEVLTGRVADANGPWLAERLLEAGIELAHTTVCGDRPEDMDAQLRFLAGQGVDVIVTSGGLGPTADDLTLEVVAAFAGRELVLDEALEGRITAIVEPLMRRWPNVDPEAVRTATRKQAMVPAGATVIEPAGDRARHGRPGKPARGGHARAAARAAVDVAGCRVQRPVPGARGRSARVRGIDAAPVRHPRVRDRRDAPHCSSRIEGLDRLEVTTCLRGGRSRWSSATSPPIRRRGTCCRA